MDYARGYDASHWQAQYINHQGAKDAGEDFAIFRAGWGIQKDGTFLWNMEQAKLAGLLVGAYWYVYPRYPAIDAMTKFVQQINDAGGVDIKAWLDVEEETYGLPQAEYRKAVSDRLAILYDEIGQEDVGIYTSASKWAKCVGDFVSGASSLDLWVAHYTSRMPPQAPYLPSNWDNWKFWQYTSSMRVPWYRNGLYNLDGNRFKGDEAELAEYADVPMPPNTTYTVKVIHPKEVQIFTIEE